MAVTHTLHGVLVLLLAGALTWAGAAKLGDAGQFRRALTALTPAANRPTVRFGVPAAELVLAGLLLTGFAPRAVATSAAVLFGGFVLVQAVLAQRGHAGGCGCFGDAPAESRAVEVSRTLMLLAAAVTAAVLADPVAPGVLAGGVNVLGQATVALGVVLMWRLMWAMTRLRVSGVSG
jgi:hypothetical protein